MSTQAKKESWVERVLSFLNVTEEAKVSSMKKRMERYYKDEERKCNAQIEKLKRDLEDYLEISKEKLEEIKEQEEQAFIEINVDKIATVELRESYVFQLDEQFNKGIRARKQKEEEIQAQKYHTKKQIELYEEKLEMIAYKKQQLL
jgi:hypothetical protein